MKTIVIGRDRMDEILGHARAEHPNECCGLMAGIMESGRVEVKRLYKIKNIDASPVSYVFDPAAQIKAMTAIESDGLKLVGIYHSHPSSPALPSMTDINRAFFPGTRDLNFPGAVYLIVSMSASVPEVRAFDITEHAVERVEIVER